MRNSIVMLSLLAAIGSAQNGQSSKDQSGATFRVGTRLVELDVVVRDKNGPVTGLTKDDFMVFDCSRQSSGNQISVTSWCKDKQQTVQMFHGPGTIATAALPTRTAAPPPPGSVSNRMDSRGAAIGSTTVLLFDQLNTSFDHKEYERTQVTKFLKSIRESDRVGIYSLGRSLHVLLDFTEDPKKLVDAVSKLDSGLDALQAIRGDDSLQAEPPLTKTGDAVTDAMIARSAAAAGAANPAILEMFDQITIAALRKIAQHMSGVPGRKNLVWIKESPQLTLLPENAPKARSILREANVSLYPVMVRSLQGSGVLSMTAAPRPGPPPMRELDIQKAARDLGALMGGTGFADAADLGSALSRAEEDSASGYLLGFYPSESDLDGKVHTLNVMLSKKAAKAGAELVFRRQYLATVKPSSEENASLAEIFASALDATRIGLAAVATPDPTAPGVYQVDITIDLSDVQLRQQGDRWAGSLNIATRWDAPDASGVLAPTEAVLHTQPINVTEEQFEARATAGFVVRQRVTGIRAATGSLRIVIQDQTSGAAGSLRVPVPKK